MNVTIVYIYELEVTDTEALDECNQRIIYLRTDDNITISVYNYDNSLRGTDKWSIISGPLPAILINAFDISWKTLYEMLSDQAIDILVACPIRDGRKLIMPNPTDLGKGMTIIDDYIKRLIEEKINGISDDNHHC